MLNMTILRKAVSCGLALLLVPVFAAATTLRLDARPGQDTEGALRYATETLGAVNDMGRQSIELADDLDLVVTPRRDIQADEDVYIRVDLTGGAFAVNPAVVTGTITPSVPPTDPNDPTTATAAVYTFAVQTAQFSSGGAGMSFVVFEIPAVTAADMQLVGIRIAGDGAGTIETPGNDIQINNGASAISASITSYTNPDEALDEVGKTSTFAGSGTIIHSQSGLEIAFKPAEPAPTSSVAHGFVRFIGPWSSATDATGGGQARVGWLVTRENTSGVLNLRHASTGETLEVETADILPAAESVRWAINGPLDFGAFHVVAETFTDAEADPLVTPMNALARCEAGAPNAPDRGMNVVDADGELIIGEDGALPAGTNSAHTPWLSPGPYLFCVNVDRMGADAGNSLQIPSADYTASAYIRTNPVAPPRMVGEGDLGSIMRDGASVNISYLTTSEKHNQRLIITNRGRLPIAITDIQFQTEDGTEASLSDIAMAAAGTDAGLIGPGETAVHSVSRMLSITGDSRRTAATLSFNAVAGNVSVATTQVNLSDSSTDTVMWPVQ